LAQYDINLREYWRILKKRKFTVILVALLMGALSTGFALWRAPEPLFASKSTVKYEKHPGLAGLYGRGYYWSSGDDIQTQLAVVKSYPVMERAAERLGKIPRKIGDDVPLRPRHADILEELRSRIEVTREEYTKILHIEATMPSPRSSQHLANAVAIGYKAARADELDRRTEEALKFIQTQLNQAKAKLREAEAEFSRFTRREQLVSIDFQGENLLVRSREIGDELRELEDARAEVGLVKAKLARFLKNPSGSNTTFYTSYGSPQYRKANNTLVELVLKRDSLLKDFTQRHPEVVSIKREIIETARKMTMLLGLQQSTIDKREGELERELSQLSGKTDDLMEKKLAYDRLRRRIDFLNEKISLLEEKNQEALIRKAELPNEVTIVKPASLPESPVNPPKTIPTAGLGLGIGLVLGMLVAFIAETFDTSLGAIEDVEETLETPVMGVLPYGELKEIRKSQEGGKGRRRRKFSPYDSQ